jgi:DNA-binding CsgD family transcriptional regulator
VAEALQPHLIRALKLGSKVDGLRDLASGLAAGLDGAPFGYFVLDGDGRPVHVNRAGEAMLNAGGGLALASGRLTAADVADGRRLQTLIGQAGACAGERKGGHMKVRRTEGRAPLSLVVAPASAERMIPFLWEGGVVVCVTDPDAGAELPPDRLMSLYDLTAGQTRVALALFEGQSVREAAESLGVSVFTVRAQLAHIFARTGVSRQSELMALMTRIAGGYGL